MAIHSQEAPAAPLTSNRATAGAQRLPFPVLLLVVSLIWPANLAFQAGTVSLTFYKLALVVLFFISLAELLRNPVKLHFVDYLIALFSVSQAFVLFYHHGVFEPFVAYSYRNPVTSVGWENAGHNGLAFLVPYLTARAFVRTREQFTSFLRLTIFIVIGLSAFTWIESVTGYSILQASQRGGINQRLGLDRAAGPFPHPILWGLFAASAVSFALARVSETWTLLTRGLLLLLLLGAVFTSLSSAAFVSVIIQLILIGWLLVTPKLAGRWLYVLAAVVVFYFYVDIFANRTPLTVFFSYATLNPFTGYYRILIWEFGMQNVLASPFLGIGFHDWVRPTWMNASVDSFWLVVFLRYGLVGLLPLTIAIVSIMIKVGKVASAEGARFPIGIATAWMFVVVSLIIGGFTVHLWAQILISFMFLLGCWGAITQPSWKTPVFKSEDAVE